MTPVEVLERLRLDGVGVTLVLDLEATAEPNPETLQLIRDNRDSLLEHLAHECVGTPNASQSTGLTLYGDLPHSLVVWIARYHELTVEHPGGVILNARPEHAAQHLAYSAWCVLSDETKTILATSGNVPRWAFTGKTELQPIATAQTLATAEKVVN